MNKNKTLITIEVDSLDRVYDGFHSVADLYDHRCHLFIALMKSNPTISWRSKKHYDGTEIPDWFIAGMNLPVGDITYHLPMWMWEMLEYSQINTLEKAPLWDGHTPKDVILRLSEWIKVLA